MNKYSSILVFYFLVAGFTFLFHLVLLKNYTREVISIIEKTTISLVFLYLIFKLIKSKSSLFRFKIIPQKRHLPLIIVMFLMFIANNYAGSIFSDYQFKNEKNPFWIIVVSFIINSFYEELLYRGVIQNYINQNTKVKRLPISQGNLFSSILMLLAHVGFFTIMNPFFAVTSLLLVLIFSLIMGVIRDAGGSIWILVIIHTLANAIHVLFNLEYYIN